MMKKAIFILYLFSFFSLFASTTFIDTGLDREMIYFKTDESPGSIIIHTDERRLYYILGDDLAYEFPIAVGKRAKDRFYGVFPISRKAKWPEWRPTQSMIEEDPSLPEVVSGGKHNPLGARALYLGSSIYRIHGTNNPSSIGKAASKGCIRMYNKDIKLLYNLVDIQDMVYVR